MKLFGRSWISVVEAGCGRGIGAAKLYTKSSPDALNYMQWTFGGRSTRMPIFEYRCPECGHVFEVLIRGAAGSKADTCPQCGSSEVERLLSAFTGRTGSGAGCVSATSGGG